jgi:hypothetical protein
LKYAKILLQIASLNFGTLPRYKEERSKKTLLSAATRAAPHSQQTTSGALRNSRSCKAWLVEAIHNQQAGKCLRNTEGTIPSEAT